MLVTYCGSLVYSSRVVPVLFGFLYFTVGVFFELIIVWNLDIIIVFVRIFINCGSLFA